MSDDNLNPAFKATLDRFIAGAGRAKPDPAALAADFSTAAVNFDVQAKNAGAEIIGHAHALFFHHKKMSAVQVTLEMEALRDALRDLNGSFAQLESAHAAMTVGETASRSLVIVNQAVTDKNLATLKASTLCIVAEKIAPVLDEEIENRKAGCNPEDWALLQALSDELHAALKLVRV